jgi:hypothetical protein
VKTHDRCRTTTGEGGLGEEIEHVGMGGTLGPPNFGRAYGVPAECDYVQCPHVVDFGDA